MRIFATTFLLLCASILCSQHEVVTIDEIDINSLASETKHTFWLRLGSDAMSDDLKIPLIIIKGKSTSPALGLVAALHGNELNGIEVIRKIAESINPHELNGTIIAIPGANISGIERHQREHADGTDLNRIFPGKAHGNSSSQYVYQFNSKVLPHIDYLVDMHTASFGRENSLYVRADMTNKEISDMARFLDADIILSSASASVNTSSSSRTLRAEASQKGIPSITVEYGNPQVYQQDMIERGYSGMINLIRSMGMIDHEVTQFTPPVQCSKSYWLYTDEGGFLEVTVDLTQLVKKEEVIGILRDPFGNVIKEYHSPEDGIVIGRSSNPVNTKGGRIIHLGIIDPSSIKKN